jgi:hypothetical protein
MSKDPKWTVVPTTVGEFHLLRTQKHRRFAEFRKKGKYAWTLARDNALTREIEKHLRSDLGGSVALNLVDRASFVWYMSPSVALAHDPADTDRVEETPVLFEAAQAIADALRAEINVEAVTREAVERIGGEVLYRAPSAIQIGRPTKAVPDAGERCFGRLAPLGVTSVGIVAPWLGYVPAMGLDSEQSFYWWLDDLPWYSDGPQIDVNDLDTEVWVRPRYRAADPAVEMGAVIANVLAAKQAPAGLPVARFACDRLETCEPLRTVFADNLRIEAEDQIIAAVRRILPLHVAEIDWDSFSQETHGLQSARTSEALLLCPFSVKNALRLFADSKELLHHFLWLARDEIHTPIDPWEYAHVPPNHVPARETREITYFDFDETGYRSALTELFLTSRGQNVRESALGQLADAFRRIRGGLSEASDAICTARTLGVEEDGLDRLKERVEAARSALGDELIWTDLLPNSDRSRLKF